MRGAVANGILRSFALVVTDRRWAAPLSAMALGFGLFVGVAIGPSASGSLAGTAPIVELPALADVPEETSRGETAGSSASLGGGPGATGEGGAAGLSLAPTPEPATPLAVPPVVPPVEEKSTPEPPPPQQGPQSQEEETALKGIVAHVNSAAGSYALAIDGGELVPVHARKLPAAGTKLSVVARRLANGTFAEAEPRRRDGEATEVAFRGAVSFVDPDPADPAYTVSGRGASLLVHVEPDPSGAVPSLPALGAYVSVTAGIEKPPASAEPMPATILAQRKIEIEAGEPATYLDLAGVVTAILPSTSQLLIAADDTRESGRDIVLSVPLRIDPGKVELGDSYLATATIEADGSMKLAGLASDERVKGADDAASAQGDLRGRQAVSSVARVQSTPRSLRPCLATSDC